ncbi:MAG: KilA-N domain-containing protein [Kiritimatiellae bacterium]|nr:KilA-N domain-containing protein [Kiritimatiellia bacterium]
MKATINANGTEITVISKGDQDDYISLTDIAKYKNSEAPADVVKNWMRSRSTIDFIGLWEQLNNINFKLVEFDQFRNEAGANAFVLSPKKWIDKTNAIGITSKSGRYGGTFAHKDIAFEFASWLSPEFKLYIIKDYQRLKSDENSRISLEWNVNRVISKINYSIHTDAIKTNLIPQNVSPRQQSFTYASEADLLNVALFGKTAKEWRAESGQSKGNIRDEATIQQLIVLSNLESMNAELIKQQIPQSQRLVILNKMAIEQMTSLIGNPSLKQLPGGE